MTTVMQTIIRKLNKTANSNSGHFPYGVVIKDAVVDELAKEYAALQYGDTPEAEENIARLIREGQGYLMGIRLVVKGPE